MAILQHPKETANKYLTVSSFTTTQNAVLAALERETAEHWTVKHIGSADLERIGDEKKAGGDPTHFLQYLQLYTFATARDTRWQRRIVQTTCWGCREKTWSRACARHFVDEACMVG